MELCTLPSQQFFYLISSVTMWERRRGPCGDVEMKEAPSLPRGLLPLGRHSPHFIGKEGSRDSPKVISRSGGN